MRGSDDNAAAVGARREYRLVKWNGEPGVDHAHPFEVLTTGDTDQVLPTTVTAIDQDSGRAECQLVTYEPEELRARPPSVVLGA